MKKKIIIVLFLFFIFFLPIKYEQKIFDYSVCSENIKDFEGVVLSVFYRYSADCGNTIEMLSINLGLFVSEEFKAFQKYPNIRFSSLSGQKNALEESYSWTLRFRWFSKKEFTPFIGLRHHLNVDYRFMLEEKTDWNNIFFTYGCPEHPGLYANSVTSCDIELIFDFPSLTTRWFDEDDNLHTKTYSIWRVK